MSRPNDMAVHYNSLWGEEWGACPRPRSHWPAVCGVSPLTEVDKNPLRRYFVSLVSLYGDRRPGPAHSAAVSEARAPSVAARRSLPYLEVSPTKTQRRRRGEEAREGGDDTAFHPSYKSLCLLYGVLTGLLMIHRAIRVIIDSTYSRRCEGVCRDTATAGCNRSKSNGALV